MIYSASLHVTPRLDGASVVCLQLSGDWKNLRRAFKKLDTKNEGYLSIPEFRSVLKLANVILDEEEVYHLLSQFDEDLSGKIPYNKFLNETFKPLAPEHGKTLRKSYKHKMFNKQWQFRIWRNMIGDCISICVIECSPAGYFMPVHPCT